MNLLFDLDDTLYDRNLPFLKAFDETLRHYLPDADSGELCLLFLRCGNMVYADAMNGVISMEDSFVIRISETMKHYGVSISRKEALDFQARYEYAQNHLEISPEIAKILDWGRHRGWTLGVITNGKGPHQRDKCLALGLQNWIPDDRIMPSAEVGIHKPDPALLELAAREWGLLPDQTWYVGDSYENDVLCARSIGWHTIWLDRLGRYPADPSLNAADLTAHSEQELARLIENL